MRDRPTKSPPPRERSERATQKLYLYSVFQPSGFGEKTVEEAVFVRQGFNRAAFLFTPFWAMLHHLWLVLALWAFWLVAIVALAALFRLEPVAATVIYTLGALTFGLEADWARESDLMRKGMLLQGLSLGETERDAEQLYFVNHSFVVPSSVRATAPEFKTSSTEPPDLLGLFPPREPRP